MQKSTEIIKDFTNLPILQRLSIIESLIQSVKDDTLKQLESKDLDAIRIFYQILFLNNETFTLQSFVKQFTKNEMSITKGDKHLNPSALFGIWEDKPRDLNDIRQQDWKRNWDK